MHRRVIAYHLIVTAYGFWLPNDPRGSWSDFVRSWELAAYGPATTTSERSSLAHRSHDRRYRLAAEAALVRPPVSFTGLQALSVARGFSSYVRRSGLAVYAGSVLEQHAHLVVGRMTHLVEQTANLLKGAATTELSRAGLHPFAGQAYSNGKLPTPWARKSWSCFLDCAEDIRRAVRYVEKNPIKDGKPPQQWKFVTPYPA